MPVFIDVSDTVDAKFIKEHRLEKYRVLTHLSDSTKLAYRFQATPETVLLDRDGKADRAWTGILSPSDLSELKTLVYQRKV